MASTQSTDLLFDPKVWSDHIMAYFDDKLVYGAFALKNDTLKAEGTGLTVTFPYYKQIGAAETPAETTSLTPDNLSDDSFTATVFEVGKAVGILKKAFKKSGDSESGLISEAQRQIARVHAEKLDSTLNDEIMAYSAGFTNAEIGYLAAAAADTMNVRTLLKAKVIAFGDKHEETQVCFMHSLQWLDLMTDTTAGFLKADANDPLSGIKGFMGRDIHGMAIIVADTVKKNITGAQIDGKDSYACHFHKMNSFGIMWKQEMEMDNDKDILAREILITGNQWYAVKSFHGKVSADDKKAGACVTTVS